MPNIEIMHAVLTESSYSKILDGKSEFEKFNSFLRNKCKVIILSSSDNKRDIDKIVNNDNVVKFITKPLTENALEEIKSAG